MLNCICNVLVRNGFYFNVLVTYGFYFYERDVQFIYVVMMLLFMLSCLVLLININMLVLLMSLC